MHYKQGSLPSLVEINKAIKAINSCAPTKEILILRNITIEGIEPYIKYFYGKLGYRANVRFGEYNQILQDSLNTTNNAISEKTNCVIIISFLEQLSPIIGSQFGLNTREEIEQELIRLSDYFDQVIYNIRERTNALIIWLGFELPIYPAYGAADFQMKGQTESVQKLNQILIKSLLKTSTAFFVDANNCMSRLGVNQYFDLRYWHIAQAPYTRLALSELAKDCFKLVNCVNGTRSKCLVLDCDNTLWGGILGEEGITGISIGRNYPGSQYYEFQQAIINLTRRGIILALCSKNNEADVLEVITAHPEMLIRKEHISTWRINWKPKSDNIAEIANQLNIGLESIVFADDSEFEIQLVKSLLPEVRTIQLPYEKPSEYASTLASSGYFDSIEITQEDQSRTEYYKNDIRRKDELKQSKDLDSYYRSLSMEVKISEMDNTSIKRIAQQTQKTNQFNLTTKRYTEAELQAMAEINGASIYCAEAKDKFGDMGIIGTFICTYEVNTAIIDTFLLSCRALGRKIEDIILQELLNIMASKKIQCVLGNYIPSAKNQQVSNFYSRLGFEHLESHKSKPGQWYKMELSNLPQRVLGEFAKISSPMGILSREGKVVR